MVQKQELKYITNYGIIGVVNTLISYIVYEVLLLFHINISICNFISYLAGTVNSYFCNKHFNFKAKETNTKKEATLFFLGAFICWAIQWVVFALLLHFTNEHWAYILALPVYPTLNYIFNRLIVFPTKTQKHLQ